jgi:phosphonate transport system substrate-binding protein
MHPMSVLQRPAPERNAERPPPRPLRFVTFLAPNLFPFYRFLARHLGDQVGHPTELVVGSSYDELGQADVAFVCGLPYVEWARRGKSAVAPLAAPVLRGQRYGGRPVYFSDVIVRRDSPFRSFADLRGRSWAYNEPHSQSGYGITCFHLARQGETGGYFGRVVETGWHERSIRLVCERKVDASAIDSHVLAVAFRDRPALARRLRIIDTLGPSSIQPIVAARRLPAALRAGLRAGLLELAENGRARAHLDHALVERFVPVTDATYDDIRTMRSVAEAANLLHLR